MNELHLKTTAYKGTFHKVGGGYVLAQNALAAGRVQIGASVCRLPCLEVFKLQRDSVQIGYYLVSGFPLVNGASYLLRTNGRKASEYREAYSDEHLVVLDYKDAGALAISPLLSKRLASKLGEQ